MSTEIGGAVSTMNLQGEPDAEDGAPSPDIIRISPSFLSPSLEMKISETCFLKKSLLCTLRKLKKDELLKMFQTHLSQDYPECFLSLSEDPSEKDEFIKVKELSRSHHDYPECSETGQEDPEVLFIIEMLEACGIERSLKITLHILRNMEQGDLADSLERDEQHDKSPWKAQQALKSHLKQRFECIYVGSAKQGHPTLLNEIYTELYITEGGSGGVNNGHEVRFIETASKRPITQETAILCNDIFKPLPGQEKHIRTVLTEGIAGIGKTVSVQKFILDWAEGRANQDIDFVFSLPFRDLNLKKDKEFSLMQLLQLYFPQLKEIKSINSDEVKVVFIFDGLDECRLPLNFQSNEICCDVTESSSVDVLLTNLIQGNLLPSALLWITSRPAAAYRIPPECVHLMTEIRGFDGAQKEEYFRKRVRDQEKASRIISHLKSVRSLDIMCHIPVFCWISAAVLETLLGGAERGDLPKTLTEMYTHFLLIQTHVKNEKYQGTSETSPNETSASDTEIILKLGRLAFEQLEEGHLIFYEEDLRESGIVVREASVYSGVCTEIFKEERGLDQEKLYCFVHLSIQEYLAAVFVFHSCVNENRNELRAEESEPDSDREQLYELHRTAVDQALGSKNGHLDLFLRFLLGLTLDSIQTLLRGVLTPTGSSAPVSDPQTGSRYNSIKETVRLIERRIWQESPERTINLFHCLNELYNTSLVEEILHFQRSGRLPDKMLEPRQCSALAFVLLMSEEVLDEFDLKTYNTSPADYHRLIPVIRNCRKAILNSCDFTDKSCSILASALQSSNSLLRDLDLSFSSLGRSGMAWLCDGLMSPNCKLQTLDLSNNNLGNSGVTQFFVAEMFAYCKLQLLDLSCNNLGYLGVTLLCPGLMSPNCKLQTLNLSYNNLGDSGVKRLCSALMSPNCKLQALNLSYNNLGNSGVNQLCAALMSPNCKLQTLGLGWCNLTEGCCDAFASVLHSPQSQLRDLELSGNELQDSGVRALSAGLEDPQCKLQRLGLSGCRVTHRGCDSLASALSSNPSHLRELDLRYNHPGDSGVRALSAAKLDTLSLLVDHGGENRTKPAPRKYGCCFTLDPNTVYARLSLSEGNRKVTHTPGTVETYPYHPQRFLSVPQVLCKESVCEHCYWEVEWSAPEKGEVSIAVTEGGIRRRGHDDDRRFGENKHSWSLMCCKQSYYIKHNKKPTYISHPSTYCTAGLCDDDDDEDGCDNGDCDGDGDDDVGHDGDSHGGDDDGGEGGDGGGHDGRGDDYDDYGGDDYDGYDYDGYGYGGDSDGGDDDGSSKRLYVYRVGVYVDRPAGTVSFYSVSDSDTLTLLHTVHTHFTPHTPLYAGFGVGYSSSVSLCQLE